jgi:chemotaxis protein CheX
MRTGRPVAESEQIEKELGRITENCWTSILGVEIRQSNSTVCTEGDEEFFSSFVQITGSWQGSVALDCGRDLAVRVAAAMFGLPARELQGEEIRDALGEMTNVIGGNVKTLLPEGCRISVPTVIRGRSYEIAFPQTRILGQLTYQSEERLLRVTLREQASAGATGETR